MKRSFLLFVCLCSFVAASAYAAELQPSQFPSLNASLELLAQKRDFCGEPIPVEIQDVKERFEKELLLILWDRPQVMLWLKRAGRYFPYIEKVLRENGMPEDLKYVAVVESALRPHSRSRKGAVGFWQFMAHTGRKYGLRVNARIDERRNFFTATQAALRYFKELYEMFGSWTLAVAAYNMGEDGLMAEILEQRVRNFYRLYLPLETQRFPLQIAAVKLIFEDPARFGFNLAPEELYPPLAVDMVQVDCTEDVPLRLIAEAAQTDFKAIKDLNPQIRGYYLAPGSHTLLVPQGAGDVFQTHFAALRKSAQADKEARVYIIQKGDNLSLIADRFGIPLASLIIWNRLDPTRPIHPGDRLIVYPPQKESSK